MIITLARKEDTIWPLPAACGRNLDEVEPVLCVLLAESAADSGWNACRKLGENGSSRERRKCT